MCTTSYPPSNHVVQPVYWYMAVLDRLEKVRPDWGQPGTTINSQYATLGSSMSIPAIAVGTVE